MTMPPDAVVTLAPRRRTQSNFDRRYSRFVNLAKRILPAIAALLLLLVAAWPHIEAEFERVRLAAPRIDLREAKDLRMVAARYSGIDKKNRPFVVTADVARQNPNAADELIALEGPKGDMTTTTGNWMEVIAYTGLYQPQTQLLDLYGDVQLFQDRGNEFRTDSAHVDMQNGTGEGHDPVEGQGPFGHIVSEGFRILDNGDTIVFTGRSHLMLEAHGSKKASK